MLLLTTWLNAAGHPACSPPELEQLAANVRVRNVSLMYLHNLLPDLPWFRDNCSGNFKLLRALQLQKSSRCQLDRSTWTGPAAWISSPRNLLSSWLALA